MNDWHGKQSAQDMTGATKRHRGKTKAQLAEELARLECEVARLQAIADVALEAQ